MTSRMRRTAIAVLFLGLTGCRFLGLGAKVKPEPPPALPTPIPVEVKTPPPTVEPPGPPPKIETKAPEVPETVASLPAPPAPKPKRKPPKKLPATGTAGQVQAATPPPKDPAAGGAETATPSNVPKVGEIVSDDQKVQLQRVCDESLGRAREAVNQLKGLTLSAEQKQSLVRVNVFISQAEQARSRDPQTAKQLAERADVLSRDLVRSVR